MGLVRIAYLILFVFLGTAYQDENIHNGASCDLNITINGGTIALSKGGVVGSIVKYICPLGFYPYPVSSRTCWTNGKWSLMRNPRRQIIRNAECRAFKCPKPSIEQGTFFPNSVSYVAGDSVNFECDDGYQLLGSESRTCLINGRWNGSTALCEDGLDTCLNPGIPAGSVKSGTSYGIDNKVKYVCLNSLALIGSNERICLETGEWTGSEPTCEHEHSFDLPEEVASHFSASFARILSESNVVKKSDSPGSYGRRLALGQGQKLHIYIILDVSGSIKKEEFHQSRNALTSFIDMISRFEVAVNYGVVTFGSRSEIVVNIAQFESGFSDFVVDVLNDLKFEEVTKASQTGTNMTGALKTVFQMMVLKKASMKLKESEWRAVRHAIMIFTDGRTNMGGSPKPMMDQIHRFLDIEQSREDFLDVYAFGLGSNVDRDEINAITSKKDKEKHAFFLQTDDLPDVFNSILDLTSVGNLCGFANKSLSATGQSAYPWFVEVVSNQNPEFRCSGSIVASEWILTAAHCFEDLSGGVIGKKISVGPDNERAELSIERVLKHPGYNLTSKKEKGIREFYDYDIALVKIKSRLNFTTFIRPICLPCTMETSVALRMSKNEASCADHKKELLPILRAVDAKFVQKDHYHPALKNVRIKTGESERPLCEHDALKASIYVNVSDVKDVVTDRFLCTGGSTRMDEAISCKGDSGGPLYIQKLYRNIQVGVVSWGVKNLCSVERLPREARDFHINLFEVLGWLKQHLANSTRFLDLS
ncbi:complement factor B-like [Scyliorhinus canicula]|uniref:complement factor B-like n=1 Tax=Scyliorhinus canicula TaxID=7830 RepID=UPI0018F5F2D4|nr:complement factor B-like [Scyliorhinus canicula]